MSVFAKKKKKKGGYSFVHIFYLFHLLPISCMGGGGFSSMLHTHIMASYITHNLWGAMILCPFMYRFFIGGGGGG